MLDRNYECLGIFRVRPKLKPQSQERYSNPYYSIFLASPKEQKEKKALTLPKTYSPSPKNHGLAKPHTVNMKPKSTQQDSFDFASIRHSLHTRQRRILTQSRGGRPIFTQHQESNTCSTPQNKSRKNYNQRPQTYDYNRNLFKVNANLTHKIVNYDKYKDQLQQKVRSYKRKKKFCLNDIWSSDYQEL